MKQHGHDNACCRCGHVHSAEEHGACRHNTEPTAVTTGGEDSCRRHEKTEGDDDSGDHHSKSGTLILGKQQHEDCCVHAGTPDEGSRNDCGYGCSCGAVATYIRTDAGKKQRIFTPHNVITAIGILLFIITNIFFRTGNKWVYLGLSLGAYVLIGYKVLYHCAKNILHGRLFDENFLMTLATVGAFLLFECFEAVAVMVFFEIGERFQDYAVKKSVGRVKDMLNMLPDSATLLQNGEPVTVKPSQLQIGDTVLVRAGERVPVDCKILEGATSFDTSSLTGESIPREFGAGGEILSGYINTQNMIKAQVMSKLEHSTATRILNMVENAAEKKAKSEQFITKFARIYTPIVTFAALFVAFLLPLLTRQAYTTYFQTALIFLIVSCPCALVISIPLSYFAAIGSGARIGALFKGSNYIATLQEVNTVIFDKTGTLTSGTFDVREIVATGQLNAEQVLEYVAYGESQSNHPIAKSVMKRYGKEVSLARISEYTEIAGGGIRCLLDGQAVLIGKAGFLKENGVTVTAADTPYTEVYLAVEGMEQGRLTLADRIREDSAAALAALKTQGVKRTVMLTGDSKAVADQVAGELGIDAVYSQMLPEQKLEIVDRLVSENRNKTAYVGDGINDVLALSRADIGISTGSTQDAAMESADVVIPTPSIMPLAKAKGLARQTHRVVVQNIVFSLLIKVMVMALSFIIELPLFVAILSDVGCALITVFNALRLLRSKR